MDARICTNQNCLTIQPAHVCSLCRHDTKPLGQVSLLPAGIDGTGHLVYTETFNYALRVHTPTTTLHLDIPIPALVQSGQALLPGLGATTSLSIMDTLKCASTMIKTKDTGKWVGWILYLVECLQALTNAPSFQRILADLRDELALFALRLTPPSEDLNSDSADAIPVLTEVVQTGRDMPWTR